MNKLLDYDGLSYYHGKVQGEIDQLEAKVDDIDNYMPELVKGRFVKDSIDISSLLQYPYSIKTEGTYGTSASYYHTRLFVCPGDVVEIETGDSGTIYGFLTNGTRPDSGASIPLVPGCSVTVIGANSKVSLPVPQGAAVIAVYLGNSPFSPTPSKIKIWRAERINTGSASIDTIQADSYRARTSVASTNNEKGFFFPVISGRTYLLNLTRATSGTIYYAFTDKLPYNGGTTSGNEDKTGFTKGLIMLSPSSNGFYMVSTASGTLTAQVTEIIPETEKMREGRLDDDLSVVATQALRFKEINLSTLTLRNYLIDARFNFYGSVATYKHILIPVVSGDYVLMKKGSSNLVYAWLTSDTTPVSGEFPPFVPGTVRYTTSDEEVLVKVPTGAIYLFIYLYNNASAYPSFVGISTNEPEQETPDAVERGDGSANSKLFLNEERPYYFAQGWSANDVEGHLDKMLSLVPEGKHFISFTDIHLDYNNNFGLKQKQASVMRYVQERLRNCSVIFGGDIIGQQADEDTAKKEILWFTREYFGKFGSKFIPVLGDHDTDRVNGGLVNGLPNDFLVNSIFGPAYKYGAVGDDLGIAAIDDVTFSDDAEVNAAKKTDWKEYMKMNYYVDDNANKIRFIIITQGAVLRNIPSRYNVPGESLYFVCNALQSVPNDYDVVVIAHEYQFTLRTESETTASVWDAILFEALSAFKNKTTFTLTSPYYQYAEESSVWSAISAKYGNANFDFSEKTGTTFAIQGDNHYDFVGYWNYSTRYTHFAVNYTPAQNDVLLIVQDRSALGQNVGFQSSWGTNIPEMLKAFRRAKASVSDDLIGTTKEVLFDVFTINDDGLTITRFGDTPVAGKPGLYPSFDEAESYSAGEIVIWYEMSGSLYVVKAYKFTASHSPGAFDTSEVEEYPVTVPYVRNYTI